MTDVGQKSIDIPPTLHVSSLHEPTEAVLLDVLNCRFGSGEDVQKTFHLDTFGSKVPQKQGFLDDHREEKLNC